MQSAKNRNSSTRSIRREFWIGNREWHESLDILQDEYKMSRNEAVDFLGDSTNLSATDKVRAKIHAIPFGVILTY